jgi:hypothetical protein
LNDRLTMALRAMDQCNISFGALTEVKHTVDRLPVQAYGYQVKTTAAAHHNLGGVALFWRKSADTWSVESERCYGPNVISCELVMGQHRWLVIAAYIPPSEMDGTTVDHVLAAHGRCPNLPVILLGDLNVRLAAPREGSERDAGISAMVAELGVQDLLPHFRQRRTHRDLFTWRQVRDGRLIASRPDYILANDRRFFKAVRIVNPRLFNSDHFAIIAEMTQCPQIEHRDYLRTRKDFPLRVYKRDSSIVDMRLHKIHRAGRTAATKLAATNRASWISDTTWRLIDRRTTGRRQKSLTPENLRQLDQNIRRHLRADRKRRATDAGRDIEHRMRNNDLQGAWDVLKRWYRHASGRPPKPSRLDFAEVETIYGTLYTAVDSPGDPLPVRAPNFMIPDLPPDHNEIVEALRRLKTGKAPGPSGLRVETLKTWLDDFTAGRNQEPWMELVALVQHCFSTGELPTALGFSTLVLIPKGDGGMRGIGLLETVWKLMSSIVNRRLCNNIVFDDALHGFRAGRGTGTATLEAKLSVERALLQGSTLFTVFLDLSKAYDTLDRERTLLILQGYGVGPNVCRLLQNFWEMLKVVPRQGGYYGQPISSDRGVTQGDVVSPTIFNIVVDAVIREWRFHDIAQAILAIFFADDGRLDGVIGPEVQGSLDLLTDLFARMGLKMNAAKTKSMVGDSGISCHRLSSPAMARRHNDGDGPTYSSRKSRKVICEECGTWMQERYLPTHLSRVHGRNERSAPQLRALHEADREPVTYRVSVPGDSTISCPVAGCGGGATTRDGFRRHFAHRHPVDIIIIVEEGPRPLPRCARCDMFVPPFALRGSHPNSRRCAAGALRKQKRELEVTNLRARNQRFQVLGANIDSVDVFRYLGRPMSADDSDWPAVQYNITKARARWAQVSRVLVRDGATPKISALFYKAVCMSVLLFGSETWVLTEAIIRSLSSFHLRAARQITRQYIRPRGPDCDEWIYPPVATTLKAARLYPIQTYLRRRRQYLLHYAQSRPIYQECEEYGAASLSNQRKRYWWSPTSILDD